MTLPQAINDLSRHNISVVTEINEALGRVVDSGWYILGKEVASFEQTFAEYCGTSFAVGVANGTDALELALVAVGVQPGQKVALAANAGGYGTTAVNAMGAVPIYVDIDVETYGLDPYALDRVLHSQDIHAVIATHLYGQMADIVEISRLTRDNGVKLIEDCAQAHGAVREGKKAGSWGDASAFSFYPTKNLGALGDGGAVVTSDSFIANQMRRLRQYGWEGKYRQSLLFARNSRLDEVQAAILLAKLPHLDRWNATRRAIASHYSSMIKHPKITLPPISGVDYVAHLYVLRTQDREALSHYLHGHRVPHDIHYPLPDYRQPAFGQRFADVLLPVTERVCAEVLTLPCFPEMTPEEVNHVVELVNQWES